MREEGDISTEIKQGTFLLVDNSRGAKSLRVQRACDRLAQGFV